MTSPLMGDPQILEVNGDTEIVTINGKDYAIPIKRTILFQLFGKPDMKESKVNTIYTWHELGIWGYEKPDNQEIYSLSLQFNSKKEEALSFSPKNNFVGKLTLNGKVLNKVITDAEIKDLGFEKSFGTVYRLEGKVMGFTLWLLDAKNVFSVSFTKKPQ